MKALRHILLCSTLLLLFSCAKDETLVKQAEPVDDRVAEIEKAFAEVEKEIADTYVDPWDKWAPEGSDTRNVGQAIYIPAGSNDALQDAVNQAKTNQKIILQEGPHYESERVVVSKTVWIQGEDGAKLIFDSGPTDFITPIESGLHIYESRHVKVTNLIFETSRDVGGNAILVENSIHTTLRHNTMNEFQFGILVEHGDHVRIMDNIVNTSPAWLDGTVLEADGIIVINGDFARVERNVIKNSVFGLFVCDHKGVSHLNEFYGNLFGMIFCKVPAGGLPLPNGNAVGAENPATDWVSVRDYAHDNLHTGIITIDGANNCNIYADKGGNNVNYDIELVGDSNRFGFFTPTSYENKCIAWDLIVKDCGVDNVVFTNFPVDIEADPCY